MCIYPRGLLLFLFLHAEKKKEAKKKPKKGLVGISLNRKILAFFSWYLLFFLMEEKKYIGILLPTPYSITISSVISLSRHVTSIQSTYFSPAVSSIACSSLRVVQNVVPSAGK